MVIYDLQTRSELQVPGDSKFLSKNSKRNKMIFNDDASINYILAQRHLLESP